jgi:hypothetical protein
VAFDMRATVDLDDPSVSQIRESWQILASHGDGKVFGRVSSSDTGIHLKVHGCDPEKVPSIRLASGDDRKRIHFDAKTSTKPQQILFSDKRGKSAGEWCESLESVLDDYRRLAPVAYQRKMLRVIYPVARGLI